METCCPKNMVRLLGLSLLIHFVTNCTFYFMFHKMIKTVNMTCYKKRVGLICGCTKNGLFPLLAILDISSFFVLLKSVNIHISLPYLSRYMSRRHQKHQNSAFWVFFEYFLEIYSFIWSHDNMSYIWHITLPLYRYCYLNTPNIPLF